MTIQVIDSFNRTGSNLATNPSGRWELTSPGGGLVNDWSLDGQVCYNASTMTAASRCLVRFKQTDPGTNSLEVSLRMKRATANVTTLGVHVRSNRSTLTDHARIAFLNIGGQFQLRIFSSLTTSGVYPGPSSPVLDQNWHTYRLRVESVTGSTMRIQAWYDSTQIFNVSGLADQLTSSAYRGAGWEIETPVGFVPANVPQLLVPPYTPPVPGDYVYVDDFSLADLTTEDSEDTPTLTAEPTLTPIAVTDEGAAVGTLPVNPDFGEEMTVAYYTAKADFDAPYVQTFPIKTRGRRRWKCRHAALTAADAATIKTFLDSHAGPELPFNYTAFDGSTYLVRYVEGSFGFSQLAPAVHGQAEYTLIEAITE